MQDYDTLVVVGPNAPTRQTFVLGLYSHDVNSTSWTSFSPNGISSWIKPSATTGLSALTGLCAWWYELELRREAIECTRERGMAIQEALLGRIPLGAPSPRQLLKIFTAIGSRTVISGQGQDGSTTSEKSRRLGKSDALSFAFWSQAAACPSCSTGIQR